MLRFTLTLDDEEAEALAHMAEAALRDSRDQLRFLLRQAWKLHVSSHTQADAEPFPGLAAGTALGMANPIRSGDLVAHRQTAGAQRALPLPLPAAGDGDR